MTRKNYEAIACLIQNSQEAPNAVKVIALGLCTILKADNPRFDEQMFLDACGIMRSYKYEF